MILSLIYYNDPILRKKCKPVEKITSEIKQLAQDMIETMDAHKGIGLAAPQVGKDLSMFVMRKDEVGPNGEVILGEAWVFINPKLSKPSDQTVTLTEGCLSIPGIRVEVERPECIYVDALDLEGNKISKEICGYTARVIMHENDHLNGVLMIDRISEEEKQAIHADLRELKERYSLEEK